MPVFLYTIWPCGAIDTRLRGYDDFFNKIEIFYPPIKKEKFYMVFKQDILDENEEKTYITATVKVVAIHNNGHLYRSLPEQLLGMIR